MVTVFLRGGLGNQMFQYAAGLALAKKNNTKLVLDTTFLNDRFPRRDFAYRTYDLGVFDLHAEFTTLSKISGFIPVPGIWLGLDLASMSLGGVVGLHKIIKEKNEHVFDPSVLAAKDNAVLWGRWQTEKYFKDIASNVRAAFALRDPFAGEAAQIAEEISNCDSISLHVRRGDYAAFKNVAKLHGEADLGYYDRAAAHIAGRVASPHFFIFSDDVPWCRENIKLKFPMTFVDDSTAGPHDAFHLELMSRCKHNIITNSTFSWWGAWRNPNPAKIVIAPKRWYADPAIREGDMVPTEWERI